MVSYVQLSMVRFFKVVHCFSALRSAQLIWSTATERLSSDLVAYDISIGWLLVALYSLHGLLMFPHLSFVTPIFFHIHARHSWEEFKSVGAAVRPFCSPNSLTNLWGEEFSALVALQFRLQQVGRESVEICQVESCIFWNCLNIVKQPCDELVVCRLTEFTDLFQHDPIWSGCSMRTFFCPLYVYITI